jgi:hypothetical protein
MNQRELDVIQALLICLNRVAPGVLVEAIIHADICAQLRNKNQNAPSLSEFNRALVACDQKGWISGKESQIAGRMKWKITDEGQLALEEM